jgi:Alginate export
VGVSGPAVLSILLVVTLSARQALSEPGATAPKFSSRWYDVDYGYLRDPKNRTGVWWEPLKVLPPRGAGNIYLALGGELRLRYEHFENNLWGEAPVPDDGYFWYRAMPYVDLHLGPRLRLFAQLVAAFAEGVAPADTPVDETEIDLMQAFAELQRPLGERVLALRAGRQLLAYGSERLISTRYGPNVLRPFDGLVARLDASPWRADAFYVRPVDTGLEGFDDAIGDSQALWSLYITRALALGKGSGIDLYYIGYENEAAVFNQGTGEERRHTLGTRIFGTARGWDWNFEAFYQFGDFVEGAISAWSVASDTGYTFAALPFTPRLGLRAGIISGDEDPADPDLQTFNPLFPKGKYFDEIGLLGPYNLFDVHPMLTLTLGEHWEIEAAAALYWRESREDGLYDNGGGLIRADGASQARFIGTQTAIHRCAS